MKDRIKQIRKHSKMSQGDFGESLGVSRDAISNYELGRVIPSDLFLNHLCRTYNVNRVWLETGEGNMFNDLSRDEEIAGYIGSVLADEDDSFQKRLISALSKMTVEEWEILEKLVTRLAQNEENKKESE